MTSEIFDNDELLALARVALERNDVEGALGKLKKIINSANPSLDAIGLGAQIYGQLRLFEKAGKLYEKYLEVNPGAFIERFQLGMTRFDLGKQDEALKIWEMVLKDQPDYPPVIFYKSLALAQIGKTAEAVVGLNNLLKLIQADNIYFNRAKELLQAIESNTKAGIRKEGNGGAKELGHAVPSDPYRTEH